MHIVFDIGGTNTRIAATENGTSFNEPHVFPTPAEYGDGIERLVAAARDIAGNGSIDSLTGGIAGPLDEEKGMLVQAPHLPGWIGKPFRHDLAEAIGAPVVVENDAAVVGLGEAKNGAGKEFRIVAYITVSTGVGGARIVDGRIDHSAFGFEPGHQVVDADASLGGRELEDFVSGCALEKRYGKKSVEITDANIWHEAARHLAVGLVNVAVFWSPEAIVLGGPMIVGNPGIALPDVERHFNEMLTIFPKRPILKGAQLESLGGLYGACALLSQRLGL
jgi:glucokinase